MKLERGLPRVPRCLQRTDPNPRIDRIIAKRRGRIRRWLRMSPRTRVLRGNPTFGARLDNMLGAPAIPPGWRHVSDVRVPQNMLRPRFKFSGPWDVA